MKKLLLISALALCSACVPPAEKKAQTCDDACEENNNETNNQQPGERPDLKGSFIAGHLGNYWDCPSEGYDGEASSSRSGDAPAGAADLHHLAGEVGVLGGGVEGVHAGSEVRCVVGG